MDRIRVVFDELEVQQKTWPTTGFASACLEALGLKGGKRSLEKGDTWGSDNTTCADGQLVGKVQVFSGSTKQMMSEAVGQDLSVLGSCEKSRDHIRQDISIEHRGSFSHGPKSPTSQGPKGSISQGSPSTKAPVDKNEKDNPMKKNATIAVQASVIFQAKANEKGKQILGKGSLKKVARAKGKVSDDQTLAQMLKIGAKRLRANEASKEENNQAPKRLCESVKSCLVDSIFETV